MGFSFPIGTYLLVEGKCPTLGSTEGTNPKSHTGLVINLKDKATCNTTVKRWKYCYNLISEANFSVNYSVILAVFSINDTDKMNLNLVNGSNITIQQQGSEVAGKGPKCVMHTLDEDLWFNIQEGDAVGACIPTLYPLNLLWETTTANGSLLVSGSGHVCSSLTGSYVIGTAHLSLQANFEDSHVSVGVQVGVTFMMLIITITTIAVIAVILLYIWYSKNKKNTDEGNETSKLSIFTRIMSVKGDIKIKCKF